MKECPFCKEEIRDEAIKCRFCGSSLLPPQNGLKQPESKPELEPNQVLLILDRGFLYFAKFIVAIVVLVLAFATAYFGFDLNKARDTVDQMRKDVQKAQKEVQEAQKAVQDAENGVLTVSKEAKDQLADAQQKSAETQARLEEILQGAQQDRAKIRAIVIAAVPTSTPNPITPSDTAPSLGFTVPEIAKLYRFPKGLDGLGKTVGLIELGGGYRDSDLDAYFAKLNLHRPKVTAVSVDGGGNKPTGSPNGPDGQVMLDIEVVGSIAPAANIVVYFARNTDTGFANAITTAIQDPTNKPSVISISWGGPESSWAQPARTRLNQALQVAEERQVTVVAAAGDNGVTDGVGDGRPHVDFPASSPWVLGVGGTSLVAEGDTIASERAWNDGPNLGATGGGISDVIAIPYWQSTAGVSARKDSSLGRGVPDVAALADPRSGYKVLVDGQWSVVGGTAAAAPLWAGLVILLNQGVGHNLGYLNPRLYQEIGPAKILRPITEGNNGDGTLPGYSAGPGWNAVAGWGTPDGQRLLDWLRTHPNVP